MTLALSSLTPVQVRMLIRMDDEASGEAIGLEAGDLQQHEIETCFALHQKGLVKLQAGWRDTMWFRLTPAGREIRIHGRTGQVACEEGKKR